MMPSAGPDPAAATARSRAGIAGAPLARRAVAGRHGSHRRSTGGAHVQLHPHVVRWLRRAPGRHGRGLTVTESSPRRRRYAACGGYERGALEVALSVTASRLGEVLQRRRTLSRAARLRRLRRRNDEDAIRRPAPVLAGGSTRREWLVRHWACCAAGRCSAAETGSLHAAAWVSGRAARRRARGSRTTQRTGQADRAKLRRGDDLGDGYAW